MKDKIIDGDILWTAEGYSVFLSGGIRLDNSGGKSGIFPVRSYYVATLVLIDIKVLDVAYSSKPDK